MAYVPQSLQISLVLQAFSHRLEKALEVCPLFPPLIHLCASLLYPCPHFHRQLPRSRSSGDSSALALFARVYPPGLSSSADIQLTAKNLPRLDEDERLSPVLTHLATSFLSGLSASEYTPEGSDGATVTAEMIDDIAKKHFPPCMRHLYERLKADRHLKHFGRLQLGLFLKVSD